MDNSLFIRYIFMGCMVAAFAGQLVLCLLSKRRFLCAIPTIAMLFLIVACFCIYCFTHNWGWLILMLYGLQPLSCAGAAWVIYALILFAQKILKLSRKNT